MGFGGHGNHVAERRGDPACPQQAVLPERGGRAARQRPELGGTYHAVAAGETSWHGYARFVIEWARQRGQAVKVAPEAIAAVPTSAYPTAAKRPLNSRLSTAKLRSAFALTLPAWEAGVERMLNEVLG